MDNTSSIDPAAYEWQSCSIMFPRFGMKVDRFGTSFGLILPGRYLVRRSRSLGRWIYRQHSS